MQDENDNDESEEYNSPAPTAMETDSVDYPDLLQVPMCGSGNQSSSTPKGRKHPFLQRSDSTLCLGCPPLDPFDTVMSEALPLADQPHLLQPHSRREDLFGIPRQPTSSTASGSSQNPLEGLPTRLGLSARGLTDSQNNVITPTFSQVVQGPLSNPNLESRRNSVSAGELSSSSIKYGVTFFNHNINYIFTLLTTFNCLRTHFSRTNLF